METLLYCFSRRLTDLVSKIDPCYLEHHSLHETMWHTRLESEATV